MIRRVAAVVAMLAVWASASAAGAQAPDPPAFEPVVTETVPVPKGFTSASQPQWTPDGEHIVFDFTSPDQVNNQLALIGVGGRGFRCLTCGLEQIVLPDRPLNAGQPLNVGKAFVFGDGRRVLVRQPSRSDSRQGGIGGPTADFNYFILECGPSLLQCDDRRLVPLVLPGEIPDTVDTPGGGLTRGVQNREGRISPDGRFFMWTEVRADDGVRMTLARLVRREDRYEVEDPRVLNPPYTLDDTSAPWRLAGPLYEAKQFSPDGRFITYAAAGEASNFDTFELDLATGERRRLSSHVEWDEDAEISPNGRWLARFSGRGRPQMEVWSQLPRPEFIEFATFPHIGQYMLNSERRHCVFELWLTDREGERGTYGGQPLNTGLEPGWHGHPVVQWHPHGTSLLFFDRRPPSSVPEGESDSRIRIARLPARRPRPEPVARTPEPTWAPRSEDWDGIHDDQVPGRVVRGAASGTATLTYAGNLAAGSWSVEYDNYSDDGRNVLDGTERVETPFVVAAARYAVDLTLSGADSGSMHGEVLFRSGGQAAGTIASSLNGNEVSGLPDAECPSLSTPALSARVERLKPLGEGRARALLTVTAEVVDDPVARPVRAATLRAVATGTAKPRAAGTRASTDRRGDGAVVVEGPPGAERTIEASAAGFRPTSVTVRLPGRKAEGDSDSRPTRNDDRRPRSTSDSVRSESGTGRATADGDGGSLPFTGLGLALMLLLCAVLMGVGATLRGGTRR